MQASWDDFGHVVLRPGEPWPPHEGLADVGRYDAGRLLYEACCEVLGTRATWEVRHERGAVEVKRSITAEQGRAIAEGFAGGLRSLPGRGPAWLQSWATRGSPRCCPEPEEEVAWPRRPTSEEAAEALRREVEEMLRRRVHGGWE